MLALLTWLSSVASWISQMLTKGREMDADGRVRDVAHAKILFDQQTLQIERLLKQLEDMPAIIAELQHQRDMDKDKIYELRARLLVQETKAEMLADRQPQPKQIEGKP
jgi:TolA-binding protein